MLDTRVQVLYDLNARVVGEAQFLEFLNYFLPHQAPLGLGDQYFLTHILLISFHKPI